MSCLCTRTVFINLCGQVIWIFISACNVLILTLSSLIWLLVVAASLGVPTEEGGVETNWNDSNCCPALSEEQEYITKLIQYIRSPQLQWVPVLGCNVSWLTCPLYISVWHRGFTSKIEYNLSINDIHNRHCPHHTPIFMP